MGMGIGWGVLDWRHRAGGWLLLVGLLVLGAGCAAFRGGGPLHGVGSYAVVFSDVPVRELLAYDLAIVDPGHFDAADIADLHAGGVVPIAYISLGEAEAYRDFFPGLDTPWLLGPNPNWPDHYYVDVRAEAWRNLLLNQVAPAIAEKGFAGFFLDTVDTASLFPALQPAMVALIRSLKAQHPSMHLIMNHGIFLAPEVGDVLSGIAVEGLFATYAFETGTYHRTALGVQRTRLQSLRALQEAFPLTIFAIDYAAPSDASLRRYASRTAQRQGFRSFVGTIALDLLPPFGTGP